MSGTGWELVDLVARWIHVIAAIMWVGNSLLFNWLDRNLAPSVRGTPGTIGEIWLLHSGAFYYVDKTLLAGEPLPKPLHWFKWQAYSTWLSGMALLIVVYWFGGRAAMADPGIAPLSHNWAVMAGIAAIAVGWALYESMQRWVAPRAPLVATVVWLAGLTTLSMALLQLLNGRAAFLHVGAMIGTIMAANVFFTIVPSQRQLVASVAERRGGDPAVSERAKRVSIHNNYFVFPVIILMMVSHFPAVYGHRQSWLLLLVLVIAGAAVRHLLNVRFTFSPWHPALAATILVSVAALYSILRFGGAGATMSTSAAGKPVSFAETRSVIDRRCTACHSAQPSDRSFGAAPGGVAFDTPEQIIARAARIHERAVVTRTMPPSNKTSITDAERALLARWIEEWSNR